MTAPRPAPDIRSASDADLRAIGGTCMRAFRDDPVWRWLLPSSRWDRSVPYVFRFAAAEHVPHGTTWVTDEVTSVAVWAPPGHRGALLREAVSLPRLTTVFRGRSVAGLRYQAAMRKAHPVEPHWYLALLATDPAHQGKGLAASLLQPTLDRCDDEGVPAYLETSKESNVAYYHRHGFELHEELHPVAGAPPIWRMWRDPR